MFSSVPERWNYRMPVMLETMPIGLCPAANRPALTLINEQKACRRYASCMTSENAPLLPDNPSVHAERVWIADAIARLDEEQDGCAETPMLALRLSGFPDIGLLLKDESAHPTGSLKHRLARSLFLYALCSGRLRRGQTVIDASSGSTAISEAWFARRLGLPFIAVMPRSTSLAKQVEISALGGQCALLEDGEDATQYAQDIARRQDACYLDQFNLAGSATDWRGNNNIAQSILAQSRRLGAYDPDWIVCGAGTGGTSATIGRYLRYVGSQAMLCVAEPAGAAFAQGWQSDDRSRLATRKTCIEGIGRSRVEPCFAFELVETVLEIDDQESIAGAWLLERWLGRRFGGSSGTNLAAALRLAAVMKETARSGNILLLLCDKGERYADTLFDPAWLAQRGYSPGAWLEKMADIAGKATLTETPGCR